MGTLFFGVCVILADQYRCFLYIVLVCWTHFFAKKMLDPSWPYSEENKKRAKEIYRRKKKPVINKPNKISHRELLRLPRPQNPQPVATGGNTVLSPRRQTSLARLHAGPAGAGPTGRGSCWDLEVVSARAGEPSSPAGPCRRAPPAGHGQLSSTSPAAYKPAPPAYKPSHEEKTPRENKKDSLPPSLSPFFSPWISTRGGLALVFDRRSLPACKLQQSREGK